MFSSVNTRRYFLLAYIPPCLSLITRLLRLTSVWGFACCTTPLYFFPYCRSPADVIGIACLHLHLLPSSDTHSESCLQLLAAYILLLIENLLPHLHWQKRGHLDRALSLTGSGFPAQCVRHITIFCLEPFCYPSFPCLYKALSTAYSSFQLPHCKQRGFFKIPERPLRHLGGAERQWPPTVRLPKSAMAWPRSLG